MDHHSEQIAGAVVLIALTVGGIVGLWLLPDCSEMSRTVAIALIGALIGALAVAVAWWAMRQEAR